MRSIAAAVLLLAAAPANAEVVSASANGFVLRHTLTLTVPPDAAYAAFTELPNWWSKGHTYSGDAANLSFSATPGGCFCERLPTGGGIEHMRVAFVKPGERIVLTGALGPLLYEATAAVMDAKFERIAGGTRVVLDYKAAGFAGGGADRLAGPVDKVLGEQVRRYRAAAVARPRSR